MTGRNGKPAAGRSPADLETTLNGCWVALVLEPDSNDTSLWAVMANDTPYAKGRNIVMETLLLAVPDP